jgi:adenine-specific DNA-methyltransferase
MDRSFAKHLRRNSTDAEHKLWQALRSRQLGNMKFRRQVPVGPYIVDFVCPAAKLVIEIDGGQHAEDIDYDRRRSEFLAGKGYHVIRFWNNEVLGNLDGVYQAIELALREE